MSRDNRRGDRRRRQKKNYMWSPAKRQRTTGDERTSRSKFAQSFAVPSPSIALCNAPFNAPSSSPVTPLLLVIAWYCAVLPCAPKQPQSLAHTAQQAYCCLRTRRRRRRPTVSVGPCGDVIFKYNEYSMQIFCPRDLPPYCQFSVCSSWRWKSRTLGPSAGAQKKKRKKALQVNNKQTGAPSVFKSLKAVDAE